MRRESCWFLGATFKMLTGVRRFSESGLGVFLTRDVTQSLTSRPPLCLVPITGETRGRVFGSIRDHECEFKQEPWEIGASRAATSTDLARMLIQQHAGTSVSCMFPQFFQGW
jgi:hypothetical protein